MPCPRTQQANLLACSPQPPINAERQAGKLWIPFKSFGMTRQGEMNPGSTDCEADALTTTPSRHSHTHRQNSALKYTVDRPMLGLLYVRVFPDMSEILVMRQGRF